MKRIATVFISSVCTLCTLALFDRTIIAALPKPVAPVLNESLILPPHTTARYTTSDFSFTVTTNADGLRGEEITAKKPGAVRVLTLGDSFTYGWGVAQQDSWPEKLRTLAGSTMPLDIINVAYPGASPINYLDDARVFIPLYRPDIVLIGLLEADDIAQLMTEIAEKRTTPQEPTQNTDKPTSIGNTIVSMLAPNSVRRLQHRSQTDIKSLWKRQTQQFLKQATPDAQLRWKNIDSTVQASFLSGTMNPGLLWLSLFEPNHYTKPFATHHPDRAPAYSMLRSIISEIAMIASQYHAKYAIVDIPTAPFVEPTLPMIRALSLDMPENPTTTMAPITSLREGIGGIDIPIIETLTRFRAECNGACFYPNDTHMNQKGHTLVAEETIQWITSLDLPRQ